MMCRLRCLAATLLMVHAAGAQNEVREPEPWMTWDLATGDWDRNRPLLEDRGIAFFATYTSEIWGGVAGGTSRGAVYSGVMQFGLDIDFEKLAGWRGASFNTTWVWIAGGDPTTQLTGALFPASGSEAPAGFRALDLWLQQKFFDDILTVRAGMFNADRDFTISKGSSFFLNSAFGWPILYEGQMGGPPAYPFAAPGLYAAVEPGGGWKFQAAAMQGTVWPPGEDPTGFYWRFDRMNGMLFLGEAHYGWDGAPLPGTAKIGAMFDSGYPDYVDEPGGAWGGALFYGIIDQMLWREPGTATDSLQGLAWFTRAALSATPDRSPVGALFNSGFTWTGLLCGRDDDTAGLAMVWTRLSPGEAAQLEGANRGNEFVLEASYELQLTPCLALQPDLQFVVQPGGSTAVPDALIIGLSASIAF